MSALCAVVSEDVTHEVKNSQQHDDSPPTRPGFDDALQTGEHKQQTSPHQVCVGIGLHWSGCSCEILTSIVRLICLTEFNIKSQWQNIFKYLEDR